LTLIRAVEQSVLNERSEKKWLRIITVLVASFGAHNVSFCFFRQKQPTDYCIDEK